MGSVRAHRGLLVTTSAVAGISCFVATAIVWEALTDRDWTVSGPEWPLDFATTVALLSLTMLGHTLVTRRSSVRRIARQASLALRLSHDPAGARELAWLERGRAFSRSLPRPSARRTAARTRPNPLRDYFANHREGRGVWKWEHYLDVYHRHFERFRGTDVHVVEVGVYSGGSLEMWRDYFGPKSRVYGVDIDPACSQYEDEQVRIFIGDQADRDFWRSFRDSVPRVDVVVDDGGHEPDQQRITLEELVPHLSPGGVYLCEDITGERNAFAAYVAGLIQALGADSELRGNPNDPERSIVSRTTPFQATIDSIHTYPFAVVLEKRPAPAHELVAPMRGSAWCSQV